MVIMEDGAMDILRKIALGHLCWVLIIGVTRGL